MCGIFLVDNKAVEQVAVIGRHRRSSYRHAQFCHHLCGGSLDRIAIDNGRYGDYRRNTCAHLLSDAGKLDNGVDADKGVGWAYNNSP